MSDVAGACVLAGGCGVEVGGAEGEVRQLVLKTLIGPSDVEHDLRLLGVSWIM